MKRKVIYFSLLSIISFLFLSYLSYNYDFEGDGYRFSHDRDVFPQKSKIFIDYGVVVTTEKTTQTFPEGEAWLSHLFTWEYPNGFPILISSFSMLTGFSTMGGLFLLGLDFILIIMLSSFILSHLITKNTKIALLSCLFMALTPTLGTIHGNLLSLPSTLSFMFLLIVVFIILRFPSSPATLLLAFIFGSIISMTHRPTNYFSTIIITNFIVLKDSRLKSLSSLFGLLFGLFINYIYSTKSESLSLFSLPKFMQSESNVLFFFLGAVIVIQLFKLLIDLILTHLTISRFEEPFFNIYSLLILSLVLSILISATFFDYSVSEVITYTKGGYFLNPFLIVGYIFFPAIFQSFYKYRKDIRLFAIITFFTVMGGTLTPIDPSVDRLLYYGSMFLTFFYASFVFSSLKKPKKESLIFILLFVSIMFGFTVIKSFGFFGLQNYDNGISYNNAVETANYLNLVDEPGEQIIFGQGIIISKVGSMTDNREFDYYITSDFSHEYYLEKGVPDFFVYRNYRIEQ